MSDTDPADEDQHLGRDPVDDDAVNHEATETVEPGAEETDGSDDADGGDEPGVGGDPDARPVPGAAGDPTIGTPARVGGCVGCCEPCWSS